jgi:O-antigen/teichoic acid export membrane protein
LLNKLKPKSEFSKNFLTLMTGTTIAQAIPIAISPILTRLYTPEDFGVFALFISIVSILSIISTGRYEVAIMLPKKDVYSIYLSILSLIISLSFSFLLFTVIVVFNDELLKLLNREYIFPKIILYLIPLVIFLINFNQICIYLFNRFKFYKLLAFNRLLQSFTTNISNLLFGFLELKVLGLVLGNVLGLLVSVYNLIKNIDKLSNIILFPMKNVNIRKLFILGKRYIDFPKYDMLAILANSLAQQVPFLLFNIFFTPFIAGNYYLTQKLLQVPIIFIGRAFLDVFKEEASKEFIKYGNAKKIYKITLYKLFSIGFIPSIFLFYFAKSLFVFFFGSKWSLAGEYVVLLIPMLFLRFISIPLSFMFYIGNKQKLNLIMQIVLLILIIVPFFLFKNDKIIVFSISILFSLFYSIQIFVSAKIAKVI